MDENELNELVQSVIEERENDLYESLRAAVFDIKDATECSVPTVLGWLRCVASELELTIMEDVDACEDGGEGEEGSEFVEEDLTA